MKKITSIEKYPLVAKLLNNTMEDEISEWIRIEDTEIEDKNFLEKYNDNSFEIADDLNNVATAYLNEGFLNGYIIATKILKGELM